MSLTTEQLERWGGTLADGQATLNTYLASPVGQADPDLALLTTLAAGLAQGNAYLALLVAQRRLREVTAVQAALAAEITQLQAVLAP